MSHGKPKIPAPQDDDPTSPLLRQHHNPDPEAGHESSSSDTDTEEEVGDETVWDKVKGVYSANIGLFFVFMAQFFGSIVSFAAVLTYPPFLCRLTN